MRGRGAVQRLRADTRLRQGLPGRRAAGDGGEQHRLVDPPAEHATHPGDQRQDQQANNATGHRRSGGSVREAIISETSQRRTVISRSPGRTGDRMPVTGGATTKTEDRWQRARRISPRRRKKPAKKAPAKKAAAKKAPAKKAPARRPRRGGEELRGPRKHPPRRRRGSCAATRPSPGAAPRWLGFRHLADGHRRSDHALDHPGCAGARQEPGLGQAR